MITALLTLSMAVSAPADTASYAVWHQGFLDGGGMTITRSGETTVARYHQTRHNNNFSGREMRYRFGPDGALLMGESRPLSREWEAGEVTDRFEVMDGRVTWTRDDGGSAPFEEGVFYRLQNPTPFDDLLLARFLLDQPNLTATLLPEGTARAEVAAHTLVPTDRGLESARLILIHGVGSAPRAVWLDEEDDLLATSWSLMVTMRHGADAALPALRAVETLIRNAHGEALARQLRRPAAGPVVIRGGDLFDSEQGVMIPDVTVVMEGDRITAVGPAESTPIPAGSTVIDAEGKTVMPGMWDMHTHHSLTTQYSGSLTMLATGLTTVRDIGADPEDVAMQRDRAEAGLIVSPRLLLAGFMEGPEPGLWAARPSAIVGTEEEARAWVERFHELGFRQLKLYNLIDPDIVPVIVEEAKRREMRVSGHIPRGLSVQAAVTLGFDEVNHAPFLFSTFFQDSLYVPEMRPYSGVARAVAADFDVDGPEMTELIRLLKEHETVIDGTFHIWTRSVLGEDGGTPAARNYARLLKRLYDEDVPLIAGTDNTAGSRFVDELEVYEWAGIPAPAVLQIATIEGARAMGEEADYGSVSPGKVADILIVNGRPAERISDLRDNVETVIRAGVVYDTEELREAARGQDATAN